MAPGYRLSPGFTVVSLRQYSKLKLDGSRCYEMISCFISPATKLMMAKEKYIQL
jgi:hypothetical protein